MPASPSEPLPVAQKDVSLPALDEFQAIRIEPGEEPASAPQFELAEQLPPLEQAETVEKPAPEGSFTRPTLPAGVKEYFMPNNRTLSQALQLAGRASFQDVINQGLLYHPTVLGQIHIRFINRTYVLDYEMLHTVIDATPDRRGAVQWDQVVTLPIEARSLGSEPAPDARFAALEAPFTDARLMAAMQRDFLDWAYRTSQVVVRAQELLKVYADPGVSQADFRRMVADAARLGRDAEPAFGRNLSHRDDHEC